MASRKVQVQVAKAYRNTVNYLANGLTLGKFRDLTKELSDEAPILTTNNYRENYDTPFELKFLGSGVIITSSDGEEVPNSLFPEWASDLFDTALSNSACEDIYAVASEILMLGATEDSLPEEVVEKYGDVIKEYLGLDGLPEGWKKTLYPGYGEELLVYYDGDNYYIRVNNKKIQFDLEMCDFPNIGEEVEIDDDFIFILKGVLPASMEEVVEV